MDSPLVSGLKAALDKENLWLERSTIAVFFGVIVEMADLLLFNKEMTRLKRAVLFFATLLIAVGCWGEWYFEHKAIGIEGRLQQISDEKIASLARAEAADNKIATTAAAHAADIGISVQTANLALTSLSKEELGLQSSLSSDRSGIEAINKWQRGVFEALSPRDITKEQLSKLRGLIGRSTLFPVNVVLHCGEEPLRFEFKLASALRSVGWEADQLRMGPNGTLCWPAFSMAEVSAMNEGLSVATPLGGKYVHESDTLADGLTKIGYRTAVMHFKSDNLDQYPTLYVGEKSDPFEQLPAFMQSPEIEEMIKRNPPAWAPPPLPKPRR
jgi:hypothetical protein